MTEEIDVLFELAVKHHVEEYNVVSTDRIADELDESNRRIGRYLAQLRKKGRVERVSATKHSSKWRPVNWRRY